MKQLTELLDIFTQAQSPSLYSFNQNFSLEEIKTLCQKYNFGFFFIDGKEIKSKTSLLEYCSVTMDFPDYFGKNWDGFEDCLTDKLLSEPQSYLIFYDHANYLAQNSPSDWKNLLDIFQSSIDFLQTHNIDLYVILQSID